MTQTENETFLSQCASAMELFESQTPEFEFSEELVSTMSLLLVNQQLDPRNPQHLTAVYLQAKPPVAPAAAPEDSLTNAARQLIASCGGDAATRQLISNLSAPDYARRSNDPVFVRADEILNPRTAQPLPNRADVVREQFYREGAQHAAVAASNAAFSAGYANHREPAPTVAGGVPNPSGMSFGDRRAAAPRPGVMTKEQAQLNEAANRARNGGEPEMSRGDRALEQQRKLAAERWSR
jgi:hypothetical protein